MTPIITANQLVKNFQINANPKTIKGFINALRKRGQQTITAVNNISFTVEPGELIGYIGPNGAGKSTTIKMMTGLLVPTSGELIINGMIPWKNRTRYVAKIGAVFGQRTTLWWDLPVTESFNLLQHMYKIPKAAFTQRMQMFRDLLALDEFIHAPVRSLSLGQRMRADICAALLHQPDIVFLDEPTIGLDVIAKERIRQFIKHINQQLATTIILTTHDLADVEKLCERVMIIDHGKILYDGKLAALLQRYGGARELLVDFAEAYDNPVIDLADLISHEPTKATYRFNSSRVTAPDLIAALSNRYRIADLSVREPDIETTIRQIYEGKLLQ